MKDNGIIVGVVVLLLVVGGVLFVVSGGNGNGVTPTPSGLGKVDTSDKATLAQCLKDSGAKFYGAFWCPHCKSQKALFGSAQNLLPYIECSTPDGNGQNQICLQRQIKSYPTWVFADGTQMTGEVALATLSEKSGCGTLSASTTDAVITGGASTTPDTSLIPPAVTTPQ